MLKRFGILSLLGSLLFLANACYASYPYLYQINDDYSNLSQSAAIISVPPGCTTSSSGFVLEGNTITILCPKRMLGQDNVVIFNADTPGGQSSVNFFCWLPSTPNGFTLLTHCDME